MKTHLTEWVKNNPDKGLNDYYREFGNIDTEPINMVGGEYHSRDNEVVFVKIHPVRLFYYTGVVMLSSIVWGSIFIILFMMILGGNFFKEMILNLIK